MRESGIERRSFQGERVFELLALGLVCIVGLLAGVLWHTQSRVARHEAREAQVAGLCRSIHANHSEILQLAYQAFATNEEWPRQALDSKLGALVTDASELSSVLPSGEVSALNASLAPVSERMASIAGMVAQGRRDDARALLESASTERQFRAVVESLADVSAAVASRDWNEGERERRVVMWTGLGLVATVPVLGLTLLGGLRLMRRQVREVEVLHRRASNGEAKYRALAESAQDFILMHDLENRLTYVNRYSAQYMNCAPEDLVGKHIEELFPPDIAASIVGHLDDVRASGEPTSFEDSYDAPQGPISLNSWLIPLKDEHGRVVQTLAFSRDVSVAKRAEQSVRESEARVRAILDAIPDALFILDDVGRFKSFHGDQNMLLIEPENFLGKKLHDVLPPSLAQEIAAGIDRMRTESRIQLITYTLMVKGRLGHFEARVAPFGSDVLALVREVSESVRRETELRESRRQLDTLLANLPGMAYRCRNDLSWTMEFISEGCLELTGYKPAALLNDNEISYGDLIHPEDRDRVWQTVQAGLTGHRPFQVTYRIMSRDGGQKWVWEQGRGVLAEDGSLEAIEGFITDITARKSAEEALHQSEARYRRLFDEAPVALIERDASGIQNYIAGLRKAGHADVRAYLQSHPDEIAGLVRQTPPLAVNRRTLQMLEIDSAREYSQNFGQFIIPQTHEMLREFVASFDERRTKFVAETQVRTAKGNVRHLLVQHTMLPGSENRFLVSLVDLTEIKQAQQEVVERRRETALMRTEALTVTGRLAAGVAHEINNPLQGIKAQLRLLAGDASDDAALKRRCDLIMGQIDQIARITRQLLDLHRQPDQPVSSCVVQTVLSGLVDLVSAHLMKTGARLELDMPKVPVTAMINARHLTQVLLNLILNAQDAMPRGGTIRVTVDVKDGVRIRVADQGIGISAEDRVRLFQPFFTTKGAGGSGLGLCVSHSLVSQTGGRIDVESAPGKGATFELHFPVGGHA